MKPIIMGKNLLTDDEILAYAMSEENFRLLTLDRLHYNAMSAALLTASLLVRLQARPRLSQLPLMTGKKSEDS
ncbi:MAG: hypothetical protein WEB07_00040 [Natronospirillum sp.]